MLPKQLKTLLCVFLGIQAIGVIGFMIIEQLSFVDALYLTVVTVATVGYGDIVPQTVVGRLFTLVLIIVGVGTVYYTLTLIFGMVVEGKLANVFGRRGMQRRIESLKNHIIVCGAGKVGTNVIERLQQENEQFVVIEKDQTLFERLAEHKVMAVYGDATMDEVLQEAGISRAKGVIAALSHDADNVYVTLTAKSINPSINIVARADRSEAEEKLRRAGANTVIFPAVMGGRQMVSAMTKPVIMDFVESVFYDQELHLDIAQITLAVTSPLVGKSLAESRISEQFDSTVVAIKRGEKLITNPRAGERFAPGDIMIVLGHRDTLSRLNSIAASAIADAD